GPSPGPLPGPSPVPRPSPVSQASVNLGIPTYLHNTMVSTPTGLQPGMQIRINGQVHNSAGRSLQAVVKFNYFNGPPLRSNPIEAFFRDSGGLAATGTGPIPVATNLESLDNLLIGMPYYALNFQPSGGFNTYNLSFTVT